MTVIRARRDWGGGAGTEYKAGTSPFRQSWMYSPVSSCASLMCREWSLVSDAFWCHLACDRSYLIINNTIMK